ncbi:hypothetical protein Agabi119p4_7183 [Agaricus bisporus var. burnettii]|uniref:PQ-loop-domain-containing protein n=1 Tax=Agaricus bisporus var. burnettii TaxID=192524 RepID=A0A8H7C7N4_AGABI|nr:hypothetical protein Agabi119p4_7183 [Agaricus bisporus var. burnettii]
MVDGDTLSNILGWISIGCWILVYSPQIYENYSIQSGEGLSLLFLLAWIVGDLCNLVGAIMGGLVSTVIVLAIYFLTCDFTLMLQVYYYRWKRSRYPIRLRPVYDDFSGMATTVHVNDDDDDDELEPLLGLTTKTALGTEIRKDGALRWLVVKGRYDGGGHGGVSGGHVWFGGVDWGDREWLRSWVVQGLGWSSAILYICGHFPQLFKNCKTRCEGLAPELFVFSAFGTTTYVLSVCAKSIEKDYLMVNASWLVGQGLTAVLDCIVIGQIIYYRCMKRESISV